MSHHSRISNHLRVRNRRKHYLEIHPEYFGASLELADPLLYDRLIRRYQSQAERETERRNKSYADTLEADLQRSEAKLAEAERYASKLGFPSELDSNNSRNTSHRFTRTQAGQIHPVIPSSQDEGDEGNRDRSGDGQDATQTALTKEDAAEQWQEIMAERFVAGKDPDFDYNAVDGNEEYDRLAEEERESQDRWFDDDNDEEENEGRAENGRVLQGETGVQDF